MRVKVNPWGPDRGLVHESNHTKHFFRHREAGDPARFSAGPCFCDLLAQLSRSHEESQEKVRNKIDDAEAQAVNKAGEVLGKIGGVQQKLKDQEKKTNCKVLMK